MRITVGLLILATASACTPSGTSVHPSEASSGRGDLRHEALGSRVDTATFAGGCFWSMVHPFDQLPGVLSVTAGYTGGTTVNPSYEAVSSGTTGHLESVEVVYDPAKVGYSELLGVYWHSIDPLDPFGQACDRGYQYRTAIFYHGTDQQRLADSSKAALLGRFARPIATEIIAANPFYPAEAYHQNYYRTHALRYGFYQSTCGRPHRLAELWGVGADSDSGRAQDKGI